ncbi:MAG TPA: class I SAM-dependent methyltransferase [Bellilinea sp.]|nr:class I SAM-dependent methyltransferase [Bellilinea sp.]
MGERTELFQTSQLDWDRQFTSQAEWTHELRSSLLSRVNLATGSLVLEPGCGTGVILGDLPPCKPLGLDLKFELLQVAKSKSLSSLTQANAYAMPFAPHSIDCLITHYFFLWVEPRQVLAEAIRVLKPGSPIIAFAEPSHADRIDHPPELERLGKMQTRSLQSKGVNIRAGAALREAFEIAGLQNVTAGLMGGEWTKENSQLSVDDIRTLKYDLEGQIDASQLGELLKIEEKSRSNGSRILFVPTFYAIGYTP